MLASFVVHIHALDNVEVTVKGYDKPELSGAYLIIKIGDAEAVFHSDNVEALSCLGDRIHMAAEELLAPTEDDRETIAEGDYRYYRQPGAKDQ